MKIIETVKVNAKNTRSVSTKDGDKLVLSISAYPFEGYIGGIWLPQNTKMGDFVTVFIDSIKKEEKGDKTYYNANFAKVTPEFNLNRDNSESQANHAQAKAEADLFGGQPTQSMDIKEDDLPF